MITHRGIDYWESPDGRQRRLLFACNNILKAIDARTGKRIVDFGRDGGVDLRDGLGRDPKTLTLVQSTTPGKIFGHLLILGSATNEEYTSGPGDVRAYDVRDGKLVWTFHTIPRPGEYGYDTWPAGAWKTVGGANAWSELTLDESRGLFSFRLPVRNTTFMAQIGQAQICLETACSLSMRGPAVACGIFRWFITTSGIMTTLPPLSF